MNRKLLDKARRNGAYEVLGVDATRRLGVLLRDLFDEEHIKLHRRFRAEQMTDRLRYKEKERRLGRPPRWDE